jgi:hypothetical protein
MVLLSSVFLQSHHDSDCSTPTEYMLQFLAKSGTLYRGSYEWLDELLKNKKARTNFLATRDHGRLMEYAGLPISFHSLYNMLSEVPVDTIKAKFELNCIDESVEITSYIEDTEVRNLSDQEFKKIKKVMQSINDKNKEEQSDNCTTCTYEMNARFNEESGTVYLTLKARCKSRMPISRFIQEINTSKDSNRY